MTSKELYRAGMERTVVSIGSRLSAAALAAMVFKDEDLAADLDDVQNRMIVLLKKHFPNVAKAGSEGLERIGSDSSKFMQEIDQEIKQRDIENLTKDRS